MTNRRRHARLRKQVSVLYFTVFRDRVNCAKRVRRCQPVPVVRNGSLVGGARAALRLRPLPRLSATRLCWKRAGCVGGFQYSEQKRGASEDKERKRKSARNPKPYRTPGTAARRPLPAAQSRRHPPSPPPAGRCSVYRAAGGDDDFVPMEQDEVSTQLRHAGRRGISLQLPPCCVRTGQLRLRLNQGLISRGQDAPWPSVSEADKSAQCACPACPDLDLRNPKSCRWTRTTPK